MDLGTRGILSPAARTSQPALSAAPTRVEDRHACACRSAGRSSTSGAGSARARRPAMRTSTPAYRFNLVSARSTIAPEGSPEPAMATSLQLTGAYLTAEKILSLDDILVKGGRGEALGTASVRFVEEKRRDSRLPSMCTTCRRPRSSSSGRGSPREAPAARCSTTCFGGRVLGRRSCNFKSSRAGLPATAVPLSPGQ